MATMPQIIYGTAWKKERTSELVIAAIQAGFRGIDTACQPKHYNESGVGDALKRLSGTIPRENLYIQTKFTPVDGQDPRHVPYDINASLSDQILQSFEVSKKNMHLDYVDGLLLHSPLENLQKTLMAWQALEKIHQQGGAKRIGISNCYDLQLLKHIDGAAVVKPTIVQNRFYQFTGYDQGIRAWCLENNVTYQSFWTLTANPHLLESKPVVQAAQKYEKTPPQILFRFLSQIGVVPLTGTSSLQHMKDDLDIFSFALSSTEIQEISSLI